MSSARPRIGFTIGRAASPPGEYVAGRPEEYVAYTSAIEEAGGEPVPLDASALGREMEVLRGLEGLLLTGGYDIDLRLYPNPPELSGQPAEEVMTAHRM